jgi:hypothetical protein
LNFPVGGFDLHSRINVSYFPNPVKDFVNFKTVTTTEKITVFNILGEVVLSKVVNDENYKMDISMLSPGSYFIKLENKGQFQTIKLLKL